MNDWDTFVAEVRRQFAAARLLDCPPQKPGNVDRRKLLVAHMAELHTDREDFTARKVTYYDEFGWEWCRSLVLGETASLELLISDILAFHRKHHGVVLQAAPAEAERS